VALGVGIWFLGLSWAVSLGHRKMNQRSLRKLEISSGFLLLLLAMAHGVHLVWQLARHRIH
jgi:hypothetical protein